MIFWKWFRFSAALTVNQNTAADPNNGNLRVDTPPGHTLWIIVWSGCLCVSVWVCVRPCVRTSVCDQESL